MEQPAPLQRKRLMLVRHAPDDFYLHTGIKPYEGFLEPNNEIAARKSYPAWHDNKVENTDGRVNNRHYALPALVSLHPKEELSHIHPSLNLSRQRAHARFTRRGVCSPHQSHSPGSPLAISGRGVRIAAAC